MGIFTYASQKFDVIAIGGWYR
jgi:hypothetical protein